MVIQDFYSKSVFLDTAPLIYFIEGHSPYQTHLTELFELNAKGGFSFITTSVTLLEVLVKPIRENNLAIAQQYRNILTRADGIEILEINSAIAEKAAYLRAKYNLRTPDAIQLGAAIESNCDFFLTHDRRLRAIDEIRVLYLDEIK